MKLLLVSLVVPLVLAQVASSAAPSAPLSTPRHFPAADVAASFARNGPLFETTAYQIHTSRRDAPGMVEVHARETDIMYVLDGTATIVTGGTVVAGRTISPGEIRGENLRGGKDQTLTKGDVFVVPNGVPHWFRDVPSSIQYYVVKVTSPAR